MSQGDPTYQPPAGANSMTDAQQLLQTFWQRSAEEIKKLGTNDFKQQELPLARIKKIMKLDEDVKMISAEAPVLFAKAAEIFITELSLRAWVHTEDNKRRTLQRNDIAMAITKFDQFDFLIDIVPRDELKPAKRQEEAVRTTTMLPDQVQYYFQLAQQHQAALQQQAPQQGTQIENCFDTQNGSSQIQIVQSGGQVQTVSAAAQTIPVQISNAQSMTTPTTMQVQATSDNQVQQGQLQVQTTQVQVQVPANQLVQDVQTATTQAGQQQVLQIPQQVQNQVAQGGIQIIQQVITPNGEIQQIPIHLSPAQVQLIRMQMQGQNANQPIIIQAAPIQASAVQQQSQQVFQIQQVASPAQGQGATPVFLTQAGQQTIQIQQATGQVQEVQQLTEEQAQ